MLGPVLSRGAHSMAAVHVVEAPVQTACEVEAGRDGLAAEYAAMAVHDEIPRGHESPLVDILWNGSHALCQTMQDRMPVVHVVVETVVIPC